MTSGRTKSAMETGEYHFQRVADSPLGGAYVTELYWLARDAVAVLEEVFLTPPADTFHSHQTYITVDHRIHYAILRALNNAARIRALLGQGRNSGDATVRGFRAARARWLGAKLEGVPLGELLDASVRNSLEHFDEYLDATALELSRTGVNSVRLLPMDMSLGRADTLNQFAMGGSVYPLRIYIADERIFLNCGKRVNLGQIASECEGIVARIGPMLSPKASTPEERGSSIIVISPATFPPG